MNDTKWYHVNRWRRSEGLGLLIALVGIPAMIVAGALGNYWTVAGIALVIRALTWPSKRERELTARLREIERRVRGETLR